MAVEVLIEKGIAYVTFKDPPLNLLADEVKKELTDCFRNLTQDSNARVIFFYTVGEHFCCGANLKEFPQRIERKTAREVWQAGHDMLASIMNTPQPTIAYVKGNALGGGAELASAFDLRIFSETVRIGYPEVQRGVFPGNGGLERLISLVGYGKAMDLVLTGKTITAKMAWKYGLATEVLADTDGLSIAMERAQQLANLPGTAVKTIKQAVNLYAADPCGFFERGKELFYQVHETEDVKEAVHAFLEKRKPSFKHL